MGKRFLYSMCCSKLIVRRFGTSHFSRPVEPVHSTSEEVLEANLELKSIAVKDSDASAKISQAKEFSKAQNKIINHFFRKYPHIKQVKPYIQPEYFLPRKSPLSLYLIDKHVAEKAVSYILPEIKKSKVQVIAESSPGLAFVTKELLDNGVGRVRLYESSPDFKKSLKDLHLQYPGQLELFGKSFTQMRIYEKYDSRLMDKLLQELPTRSWSDDPVMTVVGALQMNFIKFLMKSVILQKKIVSHGRIQFYAFMKPKDYIELTAGPELNLHTYQKWSIISRLLFDFEILDKFPREVFLPWETKPSRKLIRYATSVDPDLMYFVRINYKKTLPVPVDSLLLLYSFISSTFYMHSRIIEKLESCIPGVGECVIVPRLQHIDYFKNISIFTTFGELNPEQMLSVFRELENDPRFTAEMLLSEAKHNLIKNETVATEEDEAEKSL